MRTEEGLGEKPTPVRGNAAGLICDRAAAGRAGQGPGMASPLRPLPLCLACVSHLKLRASKRDNVDSSLLDQVHFASVLFLEASPPRLHNTRPGQSTLGASPWRGPVCGSEKPMIPQEIQTVKVQMHRRWDSASLYDRDLFYPKLGTGRGDERQRPLPVTCEKKLRAP